MGDIIRDNRVRRKIQGYVILCISLFVLLVIYAGILIWGDQSFISINEMRVEYNNYIYEFEKQLDVGVLEDNNVNYAYLNLSGIVMNSTLIEYPKGKEVNLHKLASSNINSWKDIYYISPVIKENKQEGMLIIEVPFAQKEYIDYVLKKMVPAIMLLISFSVVIIRFVSFLKNDIITPISSIHDATRDILIGNYDTRIKYDFEGEIGELCHDFEAMRDMLECAKNKEIELKEKEKLLLASISHDLKTPISSISGYVEGIRDGVVATPEEVNYYITIIMKKISVLTKLIDDILENSKTELNELTIHKEECFANVLFEALLTEVEVEVEREGLKFHKGTIPALVINVDSGRIRQVIFNLISNAVKYSEKGSNLWIDFEVIEKEMIVSVKDEGTGISAADIPFIFDKFYRGEKARTMNHPGSGLGLNISKFIVEKHGGRMECDSILGVGTTILFSIPV